MGLLDRLKSGLAKTRGVFSSVAGLGQRLDSASELALEEALLRADLGAALSARVMDSLRRGQQDSAQERLAAALLHIIPTPGAPLLAGPPLAKPEITLLVGVNGSGKTTTCGKLASLWVGQGQKVLVAGADTFRAAAVEQLQIWATRAGADFVSQGQDADPAAVAFDAVAKGKAGGYARVIIDTAGRLQNKGNLMEELRKIHRVCGKALAGAPHRVLLVLDGTSGQNMLSQARLFDEAVNVSGMVVTKLDGTAKAGAVLSVMDAMKIPVQLIGVGEAAEDLQEFDAAAFVKAMVG
jgi:fused signal recognition particle receptor